MKLRLVHLSPTQIFNWLAPENCTAWLNVPQWRDRWWSPEIVQLRAEFGKLWSQEFDSRTGHFTELSQSIARDGIKNPLVLVGGPPRNQLLTEISKDIRHIPPEYHYQLNKLVYTHPNGGSRLSIAVERGLPSVPCVVHDFCNMYSIYPTVDASNFRQYYSEEFMFCPQPPCIRSKSMTQQVRNYQAETTKRVKELMGV